MADPGVHDGDPRDHEADPGDHDRPILVFTVDRSWRSRSAEIRTCKKNAAPAGGRGRRHGSEQRAVILESLDEAAAAGARIERAATIVGLSARTVQRWRAQGGGDDERRGPKSAPHNKLTKAEEERIVAAVNSPKYADLSPRQLVPLLASEELYIASESTFYRVMHRRCLICHRQRSRPPAPRPRAHAEPARLLLAQEPASSLYIHLSSHAAHGALRAPEYQHGCGGTHTPRRKLRKRCIYAEFCGTDRCLTTSAAAAKSNSHNRVIRSSGASLRVA
jgi:transposase